MIDVQQLFLLISTFAPANLANTFQIREFFENVAL